MDLQKKILACSMNHQHYALCQVVQAIAEKVGLSEAEIDAAISGELPPEEVEEEAKKKGGK